MSGIAKIIQIYYLNGTRVEDASTDKVQKSYVDVFLEKKKNVRVAHRESINYEAYDIKKNRKKD